MPSGLQVGFLGVPVRAAPLDLYPEGWVTVCFPHEVSRVWGTAQRHLVYHLSGMGSK